jgi:hypothetical protein
MREKEIPGGIRLVGQVADFCGKEAVFGTFFRQSQPGRADSVAEETAAANVNPVLRSVQAFT